MTITEFIRRLNGEIPLELAVPDDPVGLQVMAEDRELTTIAVAYELNARVVEEAAGAGAELIVAFHPLIYPHLKRVAGSNRVERTVIDLIRRRIALYVLHTAFDAHPQGTSRLLAEALGCNNIAPLLPHPSVEDAGMGAVGILPSPHTLQELAERLQRTCGAAVVRVSGEPGGSGEREITKVAILGGSGMSFYDAAVSCGADAFITADVRYHAFHAANDSVPILDPGHAESEAFVVAGMARLIEKTAGENTDGDSERISVVAITEPTNPVRYIV